MKIRSASAFRFLPALLAMVIGGLWAWRQEQRAFALTREINALRPLAQEAERLATMRNVEPVPQPDTNELRRLQSDRLELLRLRGEITGLRRHGDLSAQMLRQRIEQSKARAEKARKEEALITERTQAKDRAKETLETLNQAVYLLTEATRRGGGRVPASWADVRRAFESAPLDLPPNSPFTAQQMEAQNPSLIEAMDSANAAAMKPSDFEFLPVAASQRYDDPANPPHLLLLRERTPRRVPDGGWSRAYGFLDGSVVEATSPDSDFAPWEAVARKAGGRAAAP